MTNKPSELPNLEASFNEISTLIDQMEHTDLSLEQSLNHFERGIHLVKHCQKILNEAEQKVEILLQTDQGEQLTTFATEANTKPMEERKNDNE